MFSLLVNIIINKPQPNLYSGDTCLSPEGVPWIKVPLYIDDQYDN